MYVVLNGFSLVGDDQSQPYVPYDSIQFTHNINDPLPQCLFDIVDPTLAGVYSDGQEVIIWDENAPPMGVVQTVPSQTFIQSTTDYTTSLWARINSPSIGGNNVTVSFSNAANGTFKGVDQTILPGYLKAGQQYMLSMYLTIPSNLTGCFAFIELDFQDATKTPLAQIVSTHYVSSMSQTRITITGTAPANTVYGLVTLGGFTSSNTNSGSFTLSMAQLEPMWFVPEGVSYPTPDLNSAQLNCALLPDTSVSRMCRVFAGIISDYEIEYEGTTRIWHITAQGPGTVLENSSVTTTASSVTDVSVINTIISSASYFPLYPSYKLIGTTPPFGWSIGSTLVTGVTLTAQFTDVSFRSVLNSLITLSGYQYYLDWYYTLWYVPYYYQVAGFALSDSPDNENSFAYYDYRLRSDGTQIKAQIKVVGSSTSNISLVSGQYPLVFQQPPYTVPPYESVITDTSLTSTAQTTGRGLTELTQYNGPRAIITCKSQKYAPAGYLLYFTSSLDNITNEAFLIQEVTGKCLGGGVNEYAYKLGAYNPSILDHLRNVTKVLSAAAQTTSTSPVALDLTMSETLRYNESPLSIQ